MRRDGACKWKRQESPFRRRPLDGEEGKTFRITPRRPVETIRAEIVNALPPSESGQFRKPDLVELSSST